MGKLLKKLRHGVYLLADSGQDLVSGRNSRLYSKELPPVNLPKNIREATAKDLKRISGDIRSSYVKSVNV